MRIANRILPPRWTPTVRVLRSSAAVMLLLAAGCASLPPAPEKTPSAAFDRPEATAVGALVAGTAAEHPDTSGYALLDTGRKAFEARVFFTELAERSLDLQYYIWESDTTGRVLGERLIRAAPLVLRERAGTTFLIVGEGEQSAALSAMAGDLGVSEKVVLAGSLPRATLPDVYAASDVFVTLSDRTNASNALDEAMMAGLAVVALDTGGTSEVVQDGENGVLLGAGELERLPGILVRLLSDKGEREALGRAGRDSADRRLPTVEERQAMEVEVAERAVREHRSGNLRARGQAEAR